MILYSQMLWPVARDLRMLGRKERRQPELFVAGALRDLLPDDHILVRVDRVLDLGWLHEEVASFTTPRPDGRALIPRSPFG
jgi:hypothetical protein